MFKKLEFNNSLISNKGNILSGRVHTINKLVRRIRKFKEQLQMKPDDKLKEKLQKNVSIMEFIKKLKPNEIIINILLLRRSPEAILAKGLLDINEVGLALLAINKNIKLLIDRLKLEFNFKDELYDTWSYQLKQINKRARGFRSNEKVKDVPHQRQQKVAAKGKPNQNNDCDLNRKINNKQTDSMMRNRMKHSRDNTRYTNITPNKQNYVHNQEKPEVNVKRANASKLSKTNASQNIESNSVQINAKTELHPSWLAKQRFKTIQPFQGKKITFGDANEVEVYKNEAQSITSKENDNGLTGPENSISHHHPHKHNSGLHPSWVAKQKLKSSVTHFQGKRIVFND